MPGRHTRSNYSYKKKSMARRARKTGRTSKARPMRALSTMFYKHQAVHRFVRETLPQTLPFSIISAGTSFPAIGTLDFSNLQFNQLVEAMPEFSALFARYKVDKIETILTPMVQGTTNESTGWNPQLSPGLRITRINTKYLNAPLNLGTTSDAVLKELAQIQSKTISNYASPRSLKLITYSPRVSQQAVLDSTNTEIAVNAPMPWLNIANQADVPMRHNSVIFAERTDGTALDVNYRYRVVHRVFFRCAQVG